jgi:hypothetical protein
LFASAASSSCCPSSTARRSDSRPARDPTISQVEPDARYTELSGAIHTMTTSPKARRLAPISTLALSLCVLAAMLLGASQTLAQTRKPSCSTSSSPARDRRSTRSCAEPSHRTAGRTQSRRSGKRHAKRTPAGGTRKRSSQIPPPAAVCEDGSAPARDQEGSFSCADGSEPICEDGATPTLSHKGKSLVCPVPDEPEPGSSETECEEAGFADCGSDELACEAPAGESSSAACEEEEGEED